MLVRVSLGLKPHGSRDRVQSGPERKTSQDVVVGTLVAYERKLLLIVSMTVVVGLTRPAGEPVFERLYDRVAY
jgi:hypothetical protein